MSYQSVENDFIAESRDGSVSPGRVISEMAMNAAIHGAPTMQQILNEVCADANRQSFRESQLKDALKALLFALHARPLFGGPHLSLEDAIAKANATLDKLSPGASQ